MLEVRKTFSVAGESKMNEKDLMEEQSQREMGPIGPWAFGRVRKKGQDAALTGIRPVVGTLTNSLLEPSEWRHHHRQALADATCSRQLYDRVANEARTTSSQMLGDLERHDQRSTLLLRERASSIRSRIDQLHLIQQQMNLEINQLLPIPNRLRKAQDAMALVYSTSAECLAIRARRLESEMTADVVEKLLIEEATAAHEGKVLAARCAAEVEQQISSCRDELQRLHADWSLKRLALIAERRAISSGKEEAHNTQFFTGALKQPGCVAPAETVGISVADWERRACLLLQSAEEERERAIRLRARAEPLIQESGRDVARRITSVDDAVSKNVDVLVSMIKELESELARVLERQANGEKLWSHLLRAAHQTEPALKSGQSRLVERKARPPTERTSDEQQKCLLDEVGAALAIATGIRERRTNTDSSLEDLIERRMHLEREIFLKKRLLYLDRDRVRLVRSVMPSRTALQGMD